METAPHLTRPPLISVIIPVYNGARFLEVTISCLLRQTFPDFEIVAYDDGSTDSSWTELQFWASRDKRIRIFRHETNQGVYQTQVDLMNQARGTYIAQQDQDDPSAPDRLATQVRILQNHPEASGCVSNIWLLDEEGTPILITRIPETAEDLGAAMRHNNVCWHSSLMMRKEAFLKAGGYSKFAHHVADYDLMLRLLKVGPLIPCKQPLATYGLSPGTVTYRDRDTQIALARQIRHVHFGDPTPDQLEYPVRTADEARASYHNEVGRYYLVKGNTLKARDNFRRLVALQPDTKNRLKLAATYFPSILIKTLANLKNGRLIAPPEPPYFMG